MSQIPQTLTRTLDPTTPYDLLIIGAGITGCAMAYEAAMQGLRVALVDKADIGGATSAATGKLIHGGLRYLKNFELGLVRESLAERRTLSNIAPGLVEPFPMILPNPGLIEHLGLWTYDLLSFDRNRVKDAAHRIPAHRSMSAPELAEHGLPDIKSAILYYDCLMPHPERLTLAFARSAVAKGAHLMNYATVSRLIVEGQRVTGAEITDLVGQKDMTVHAKVVVNATGPWAHDLLANTPQTDGLLGPRPKTRSEGIYLVTRKLSDIMVLFVSPHGHFSFAPWRGMSLIGPTETPYEGAVEDWRITAQAVDDFLERINAMGVLPEPLTRADVKAAYGGLRPLVESDGDSYNASRASELMDHAAAGIDGLVTATGGKYTTSRAFAAKAMRQIFQKLGRRYKPSGTEKQPLNGCGIDAIDSAQQACLSRHPQISTETARHLVRCYGTDADAVLALIGENPALAQTVDEDGEILAQAVYAIRHEGAVTLADVVLRRMGLGTLGEPDAETLNRVTEVVAAEAGWDAETADRQKSVLIAQLRRFQLD
nr:glycerol-3-phosphate dehydrogenase/oxidase [uncultured Celeribacter sp.]